MNCKKGDLAVVVISNYGNEGAIVQCLERYDGPWQKCDSKPGWRLDRKLRHGWEYITDDRLRPIRPDESPEQSLEAMRDLMQTKKEKVTT